MTTAPREVDTLGRPSGSGPVADRDDRRAVDEHPAVGVLGAGVVHRDDPAVCVERRAWRVTLSRCSGVVARDGTAADVLARADELGGDRRDAGRLTRGFATPALARAGDARGGVDGGRRADRPARRRRQRRSGASAPGAARARLAHRHRLGRRPLRRPARRARRARVVERAARRTEAAARVEVVAFADEEGTRFGTTYLGSRRLHGRLRHAWLDSSTDGITLHRSATRGVPNGRHGARPSSPAARSTSTRAHARADGLPIGVVPRSPAAREDPAPGRRACQRTMPVTTASDALAARRGVLAVERLGRGEFGPGRRSARSRWPDGGNVVPSNRGSSSTCATPRAYAVGGRRERVDVGDDAERGVVADRPAHEPRVEVDPSTPRRPPSPSRRRGCRPRARPRRGPRASRSPATARRRAVVRCAADPSRPRESVPMRLSRSRSTSSSEYSSSQPSSTRVMERPVVGRVPPDAP